LLFVLGWTLIQFGAGYLLVKNGLPTNPGYPLTLRNLAGVFAFQFFLSGTSEEPLYRGLIMGAMLMGWQPLYHKPERLGIAATAGATLVFMFDHINFSLAPLAVTHFNLLQQGTLLAFGIFYGWLFWKTRSLFGPILAHGLLNVVIVASGIVLFSGLGH
jgi:membrane protease YdiL (CAAX protease family)